MVNVEVYMMHTNKRLRVRRVRRLFRADLDPTHALVVS